MTCDDSIIILDETINTTPKRKNVFVPKHFCKSDQPVSTKLKANFEAKPLNHVDPSTINLLLDLKNEWNYANSLIKKLQDDCATMNKQLTENEALIKKLRMDCDTKDKQLEAKAELILKLQRKNSSETEEPPFDMPQVVEEQIEDKTCNDSPETIDELEKRASASQNLGRYTEALESYEIAINLEKSTKNDSDKLWNLLLKKAQIHLLLKHYFSAIGAASFALQYRPNCILSMKVQAKAFFEKKLFFRAKNILMDVIRLNPSDDEAQELLKQVNECTDDFRQQLF